MKKFISGLLKVFLGAVAATIGFVGSIVVIILAVIIVVAVKAGDDLQQSVQPKLQPTYVSGEKGCCNQILELPINGLILGERAESDFFTALGGLELTYGYEVKDLLRQAAEKPEIKAVVLNIQSPGGTIFGTQAIVDGVRQYREKTGKPVVAYVGSVAASGGYWVATAADKIVADSGTTLGSIGVVSGPFKYYDQVISEDGGAFLGGVVTQGGVETTYVTAGESKDLGNPYRRLTTKELATLQQSVDNSYNQFVKAVASGRKLDESTIRTQIGALVYDEQQAQELGLIDEMANKDQALELAAKLAKLDDFQVVKQTGAGGFWSQLMGATSSWRQSNLAAASGVCPLAGLPLAFQGNLAALCY